MTPPPPPPLVPLADSGRLARSHSDALFLFFFFFLPHLSNLGKPRVRKHKVFSKLVSGAFEAPPNRVSNPGDKVHGRYQPIGSRGFAYLKKNTIHSAFIVTFGFVLFLDTRALRLLSTASPSAPRQFLLFSSWFLSFSCLASMF